MRHQYSLTDQTRKALTRHVQEIADELDVTPQQLHAYLSEAQTDPYAKFRSLFRAIARVNPEGASLYLKDLSAIVELASRRTRGRDLSDLTADMGREFVEFMESRLKNMPADVQRKECMDVIQVACETLKTLEALPKLREAGRR